MDINRNSYESNNTDLFSVKNLPPASSKIPVFLPTLLNQNNRLGVTFRGNYMKQNKLGYLHGSVVNIYIVYELNDWENSEDLKIRDTITPDFTPKIVRLVQ